MKIPRVLFATWLFMATASAVSHGAEKATAPENATPPGSVEATPIPIVCEVVSVAGKPVAGARVYVSCPSSRDRMLDDPIIAQGTTDAEGIFRASYIVPAHWKAFYAAVVVDAGKDGIGVGSVFHHPPRPSPEKYPIQLQPTTEFTATILTPEGKPVADLEVWIDYFALAMPGDMAGHPFLSEVSRLPGSLWKARTDASGKCVMPMVPKGASLYLKHGDKRWAQFTGRHNIIVKPLAKADGTEARLQLAAPGTIKGRMLRPDGSPAAGSIVSIIDGRPYVTAYAGEAKVTDSGEFIIAQIPPSTYDLHYDTLPPLFERWIGAERKGVVVTAGKTTDIGDIIVTEAAYVTGEVVDAETGKVIEEPLTFRVAAGQHELRYRSMRYPGPGYHPPGNDEAVPVEVKGGERKTITFRLAPVKAEQQATGLVLNEAGEPVENAHVIMQGYGESPFPTRATTDKAGKFTLTREKNASLEMVLAWKDKAMCDPVPLVPGKPVTLKLREKGWGHVIGSVMDASGKPVENASINWFLPEPVAKGGPVASTVRSDAQGKFEFPRMWTRKEGITFFCRVEGYGSASLLDVMVKEDAPTEIKFTLAIADQFVAGTVVDAAGHPAAGVSVYASGTGQSGNARGVTDARGGFRVEKLVAGKVTVRAVKRSEDSSGEAKLSTHTGEQDIRLQLPEAVGEVTGMVVDAAGRPLPMAKVESYSRGRKTTADKDGKFKLTGLMKGWFTVDVQSVNEKGDLLKQRLRLKPGMKDVKITLPAKNKEEPALPADPVDLVGKPAAEVKIATWVNCEPLPAMGRGKVRILDFWGMECAPCIASFPKVQQFWEAHRDKGIEFLATSSFYPVEEVKEFLAKHPSYTFPVALRGDDSSADLDYDIRGVPTYVVIDAFGKIVSQGHDFEEAAKVALGLVGK